MEIRRKLAILANAAKYDASCASSGSHRAGDGQGLGHTQGMGICHSYTPDGRCVSLLKLLLSNVCVYDCQFCVNRASSDTPRATFTPREVVDLTLEFYRRNYIEGLFLSSGIIKSPDHTTERVADVARALREEHRFGGYIHLKVAPGTSPELIARAGRYADRLSANVELPTQEDLDKLAPAKRMEGIESAMSLIKDGYDEAFEARERRRFRHAPSFAPAGQSTQLVVGATDTSDAAILTTADRLYRRYNLRRVYYSAFSPIPGANRALPSAPAPLVREHRLYQADWLLRNYGFAREELLTASTDNLRLDIDPKLAWALEHPERFPVDVATAPRELLLRVPGLGLRSVERLLTLRQHKQPRLADLAALRISLATVSPFIVLTDHRPRERDAAQLVSRRRPSQLSLFAAA